MVRSRIASAVRWEWNVPVVRSPSSNGLGGRHRWRQPGKVAHSLLDLVRQRVFGLAAGYLDGNDAVRLADDPLHKLVLDREPLTGSALGSPPTLSRFENAVGRRDLVRLGHTLARTVIAAHRPASTDGPGGSRSIWTRPTIRRTASRN
jgi:Transposase DDE domain group 1